jgi:SAM-dependent methyltransferase
MPTDTQYDLIVLINVIEHCYDIERVFESIRAIARENAVLVFGDRYYEHARVARWVTDSRYDAGHPLLVDRSVVDAFLEQTCEPLYRHVQHHQWIVEDFDLSHEALYFVGRVRSQSLVGSGSRRVATP